MSSRETLALEALTVYLVACVSICSHFVISLVGCLLLSEEQGPHPLFPMCPPPTVLLA